MLTVPEPAGSRRMTYRLRRGLIALAAALVALGLSLSIVLMPWFTELVAPATGGPELTGLPAAQVRALALDVRAFVTRPDAAALPQTLPDGREAFPPGEVAHLLDVRGVLGWARIVTVVAVVGLALLAAESVAAGRLRDVAWGLRTGGRVILGMLGLVVLAGLIDFDAFFAAFHSLFFAEGTWTFPLDSLLIQLFPLRFWIVAAASWAAAAALAAALLVFAGRRGTALAQAVRAE